MSKLTKKQEAMLRELADNYSNVTRACAKVGVGRTTHYEWVNENEQYKKRCDNIQESLLDRAETILAERLPESDTALIFFLKTKGKKRGYIEKQELNISGSVDVIDPFSNV